MKHIFTVHSPITYFCAENVVVYEKLNSEDVIYLCSGYYPKNTRGKVVSSLSDKVKTPWQKIRFFNVGKASDKYLSELCGGDEFSAYIDLVHYYQKLVITHPNCVSFHFIEEGTASYLAPIDLNELTRIERGGFRSKFLSDRIQGVLRLLRGYSLKSLALPYFANAFSSLKGIRFYGFSENVYPGVPNEKRIVLDLRSYHSFNAINNEDNLINGSVILVEESYFKVFDIGEEDVKSCFKLTMSWLVSQLKNQKVFVKLRPRQHKADSLWIRLAESMNVDYTIMPDESLESLLTVSSNCKVVGTVSSLLYYAAIFGHEAYSNYGFIQSRPKSSFDYADFYWDKVQLIK